MRSGADDFLQTLISAKTIGATPASIVQAAQSALASFTQTANASDGRDYLFGGINSGDRADRRVRHRPRRRRRRRLHRQVRLRARDPAAANITGAQMSDFLDNEFGALFADPAWGTTWSSASDQVDHQPHRHGDNGLDLGQRQRVSHAQACRGLYYGRLPRIRRSRSGCAEGNSRQGERPSSAAAATDWSRSRRASAACRIRSPMPPTG